uniref:KAT8 regulatory NSL complex subunit 2 n=1 Tax=Parastrongyloides trichosuri TaxID=131310 RepID=A0A0N4ZPS4_PARTI
MEKDSEGVKQLYTTTTDTSNYCNNNLTKNIDNKKNIIIKKEVLILPEDDVNLSPESRMYAKKCRLLKEKYAEVLTSSYRLRNRLYKVKKQIHYLSRLKRVLFQTLSTQKDNFMETCLEIPDDDNCNEEVDEIIGNVLNTATKNQIIIVNKKRKFESNKKKIDIKNECIETNVKKEVFIDDANTIGDSIIDENCGKKVFIDNNNKIIKKIN